jgi:hypothetical protein
LSGFNASNNSAISLNLNLQIFKCKMKLVTVLSLVVGTAAFWTDSNFATWFFSSNTLATRQTQECSFTMSSSGFSAGPAGQLPDGQIRFNGSEMTAIFFMDLHGGITDSHGFGCVVTGNRF